MANISNTIRILKPYLITGMLLAIIISGLSCTSGSPTSASPTTVTTSSSTVITSPASVTASETSINQVIDPQAAYEMIQANKDNPDFVILDVRTQDEFNAGHISGATMIDFYSTDFKTRISQLDLNKKYLVYCRSGKRSAEAVKIMKESGFREVYDLAGGITQWTQNGLPTVLPSVEPVS